MAKRSAFGRKDQKAERARVREHELQTALEAAIFTVQTSDPQWYKQSLEASRLLYRKSPPLDKDAKLEFSVEVSFGALTLTCTYFQRNLEAAFAYFFDGLLASTPSEVEARARERSIPYEEENQVIGMWYRLDMNQCLDHAMKLFKEKFGWMLRDVFDEFCYEVVAETMRDLDGKLTKGFDHPTRFFDIALQFAEENKKRRMGAPDAGRPKGSGGFKTRDQLEWALICALRYLLWLGDKNVKVTQKNVVEYFNAAPKLPSCEDPRQLRRWMNEFGIDWKTVLKENRIVPDHYRQMLDQKFGHHKKRAKNQVN